jgi:hypothetical protein
VKALEEIGLRELSLEQKENLCILMEKTARDFINSKIPLSEVQTLNIDVEIDGNMPVTVTVDVELVPSSLIKDYDVEQLVNEATRRSLEAADIRLGEIACKSKK